MVFWLSLILLLYGVVAEKVAENVTEKAYQFEDDDYVEYRTVRWELPPTFSCCCGAAQTNRRAAVQLPKHRITKWNITYYDRSAVAPGYWFTSPYWFHDGEKKTNQWIPYQIGPHIFDQDGVGIICLLIFPLASCF